MLSQGLANAPEEVANLKGDVARAQFVNLFKDVQRFKLSSISIPIHLKSKDSRSKGSCQQINYWDLRGVYLETARRLKEQQDKDQTLPEVQQLDFEFVLLPLRLLITTLSWALLLIWLSRKPGKLTLNREEPIGLIQSDAKFIDEREDIAAYIRGLPVNEALNENRFEQALNTSRQKRRRKNSLRSPPDMTLHQMPCKFCWWNSTSSYLWRWTPFRINGSAESGLENTYTERAGAYGWTDTVATQNWHKGVRSRDYQPMRKGNNDSHFSNNLHWRSKIWIHIIANNKFMFVEVNTHARQKYQQKQIWSQMLSTSDIMPQEQAVWVETINIWWYHNCVSQSLEMQQNGLPII